MKKTRVNQQIVITRPSTTLIQSKFVLNSTPLFQLSKHRLQSQWLKPHSQAMYIHLFHQMVKQHNKSTPKYLHPQSTTTDSIFTRYLDMTGIAKIIKPCIKNRLSQDILRPILNKKVVLHVERIRKHQQKIKNTVRNKILQLKQSDPMRNALTPSLKSKRQKLRFNLQQNNPKGHSRNVLGIIEKKSPLKEQQNYGLEAAIQKPRTLLKHTKRLSNLADYQNLDFLPKEQMANFPQNTKMSNYYKVGVTSHHLTKHTSPQKSMKSSRKSSVKKQTFLKKVTSQKSIGKKEIKGVRK